MTVTFAGIPAIVAVVSDTRMFVRAPKFSLIDVDGSALTTSAVDVVITNLDALGDPIVGVKGYFSLRRIGCGLSYSERRLRQALKKGIPVETGVEGSPR